MKIIDDIFNGKDFISHIIEDEEYRNLLYLADTYREAIANALTDEEQLTQLLDVLKRCNEIERKIAFVDGVHFGIGIKELL